MQVIDILDRLIAVPSVVGTPNGAIVEWIRAYLADHGITAQVLMGPEGDRANLFATIGPADQPGYILSGHMDVVPAIGQSGWSRDPFQMVQIEDRLYGRGTSDMKGFLAACLAAIPRLQAMPLARPLHLAFSYDEESGCQGVPHMLARLPDLCAPPLGAIIGEPSRLQPICAHKGKAAARVTIRGRAGHSSRPELGLNAIHAMAEVLGAAVQTAEDLTQGLLDQTFEPPYSSLQVGTISGGQAVNIIPDCCRIDLEARAIAGVHPAGLLAPVRKAAERLVCHGFDVQWEDVGLYPALSLPLTSPLAQLLRRLSGQELQPAVSYGTEAGLYQGAGVDAVICGPGDIDRAHKPDEFICIDELTACQRLIEALGDHCRN